MRKTIVLAFAAMMAAFSNVLSVPPIAVPIQFGSFTSAVHFSQLAIFLCGILAGPWAGLLAGAVGGLYMSVTKIPFIIGGLAILGGSAGLFAKKVKPVFAGLLAWLVQAPYVLVTDYIWFTLFAGTPPAIAWTIITPIMITMTLEVIICAILANIIIYYLKKTGINF
jgi:thiamine transporter ThiT